MDWIAAISRELARQDLEEKLLNMALHGVPKTDINRIRKEFNQQFEETVEDIKIPITEFQNVGLKFGKPNTTKVIRPEHKEKK